MFFLIIVYIAFFLISWIFNEISYRKSTNDWNKMLRSPFHVIATILMYGSIGWAFSFLPKLLDESLSINSTATEWISAIIATIVALLFLYAVKMHYRRKIIDNK